MQNKLLLYLGRWQLSSPVLAGVMFGLSDIPMIGKVIIANFIGGLIFYHVDKKILCRGDKD